MEKIQDERPILLRILRELDQAQTVGPHRREMWNRCWEEEEGMIPKYMIDSTVVRSEGAFWRAPGEEVKFLYRLRKELFDRHLVNIKDVYEFGCGLGQNLLPLKGSYHRLHGFDWSEAAVRRCNASGIEAYVFDMFDPHPVYLDGAVLTVHAMEQLGRHWESFMEFLMIKRPKVCIHIEPLYELYNPDNLLDNLAMRYHEKRGYLTGLLPYLQRLALTGHVELVEIHRTFFGNMFHEAYSVAVWKPV